MPHVGKILMISMFLGLAPSHAQNIRDLKSETRPTQQPLEMLVICQQNQSDGRILVTDPHLGNRDIRFRVLRYQPTRSEGGWSHGNCNIRITSYRPD